MAGLTAAEQNALAQNSGVAAGGFNSRNETTFPSLVYPIEMRPENFYPEAMCFTIKKRIGLTLNEVGDIVHAAADKSIKKLAEQKSIDEEYKADLKKAVDSNGTPIQTAIETAKSKHVAASKANNLGNIVTETATVTLTAGQGIKELSALKAKQTTEQNIGHIYLNMPQAIAYDDSISWDAKPLGTIGNMRICKRGAWGNWWNIV